MRPRAHTIIASPVVKFRFPGLADGEYETACPTLEIRYRYYPGRAAYVPRGEYLPTCPPEPADVELMGVKLIDGDGIYPPALDDLEQWADDWLNDEGFNLAVENAELDDYDC